MKDNLFANLDATIAEISEECKAVPALLSDYDRAAYYLVASSLFKDKGYIIDAGAFLGGTAFTLAEGIKNNRNFDQKTSKNKIISLDLFEVMNENLNTKLPSMAGLSIGESFQHLHTQNLAPHSDVVSSEKLNLMTGDYTSPQPIELLCFDVLKSPELTRSCFEIFLPQLIPGESYILNQDHVHATLPFAISAFSLFSDILTPVGECIHTAAFKFDKAITREEVSERFEGAPNWEKGTRVISAIEQAIDSSLSDKSRLVYRVALAYAHRRNRSHREAERVFLQAMLDERVALATLDESEARSMQYYIKRFLGRFPKSQNPLDKTPPKKASPKFWTALGFGKNP